MSGGSATDRPVRDTGIVVLGVGNMLAGDDGVGVHVISRLGEPGAPALPSGTRVLDGGTLGLELLAVLHDARALVVVDAVDVGASPGTVRLLSGPEVEAALAHSMSAHQIGVADLLALAQLTEILPAKVSMVGVQPDQVGLSLELSPRVRAALPDAVEAVRRVTWAYAETLGAPGSVARTRSGGT